MLRKKYSKRLHYSGIAELNAASLRGLSSLTLRSFNMRVSGSGFQLTPKSPSTTSNTRRTLSEIRLGGLSTDLKGWNQLWYYGESNYEPRN